MNALDRDIAMVEEGCEIEDLDLTLRGFDRFNLAVAEAVANIQKDTK